MTKDELANLDVGDLVKHFRSQDVYVVTGNYGGRVTMVRSADMTNPAEWQVVRKNELSDEVARLREKVALLEKVNDLLAERAHSAFLVKLLAESNLESLTANPLATSAS